MSLTEAVVRGLERRGEKSAWREGKGLRGRREMEGERERKIKGGYNEERKKLGSSRDGKIEPGDEKTMDGLVGGTLIRERERGEGAARSDRL